MRTRRRSSRDRNHDSIVEALRGVGAFVFDASGIGGGFPDLVVSYRGRVHLMEIKNPESWYGKKGLTTAQQKFDEAWRGAPIQVVTTIDEALMVIGAIEA